MEWMEATVYLVMLVLIFCVGCLRSHEGTGPRLPIGPCELIVLDELGKSLPKHGARLPKGPRYDDEVLVGLTCEAKW